MNRGFLGALFLGLVAVISAQDLDPVQNFCRRIDHSSVIRNGTLYINGGLESFININSTSGTQTGNITIGINEYVVTVDLTTTWNWRNSSITVKAIPKNNTRNSRQPPNLSRGALYSGPTNTTKLWSFGGTVDPATNKSFSGYMPPMSDDYALWSYEYEADRWDTVDITSDTKLIRPASGPNTEAPDQGLAFYFNGDRDKGSSPDSANLWDTVKFLKGMIVLDLNTGHARNLSTDAVSELARVRGEMVYIPGVGKKGILVLIGGGEKGIDYEDNQPYGTLVSMAQIDIFDVASLYDNTTPDGIWYSQRATGDVPSSRMDFCLVVASAPDGSSHNIYMHGGRGTNDNYFDDIYVLSLPSFTWTNIYSANAYRYGMRCHLAGQRQMLTVGGSQNGAWTDNCDWETRSLGVYDMSTAEWRSIYYADAAPYQVPRRVSDVIGGSANGNATLLAPAAGFTNSSLSALFFGSTTSNTTSVPTTHSPTPSTVPNTSPNSGAIAGGVVGGLAGVALVGAGLLFLRRRRQHAAAASGPATEAGSVPLFEKDSAGPKVNHELQGEGSFPEGTIPLAEMPGGISTHPPQELPGDHVQKRGSREEVVDMNER